ncbi:MAG: NADH:flavin oxidoreductase [Nitrospira bacterium SG8_3]|nr:MAG: NADH:flavin oxidoreductase [Nitrospira bacterium SG8_3]
MAFPHLFSPITINNMTIKNRIVMTAMHLGYTPEGKVTDRLIDFYTLRAQGGVGLCIVGGCPIDEYGSMSNMINLNHDDYLPGLKQLTHAVQKAGAKIAAQLYQAGRYTHSSMIGGKKPFSASAVRSKFTGETPRALELEEISGVQDKFAEAALRAQKTGFDAVEILGSAGYLISQFLSPLTNLRKDHYGGSFENRMRFGLEVIEKVRRAVGANYPIIVRLAGNDFMAGGNTNKEAKVFASELEGVGADLFNVTGGWHETRVPQLTMFVPRKAFTYLAQGIKSVVSVPVLASNRINDPEIGDKIIRNGEADMVTMARALLADPLLPKKIQEGKTDLVYHCIACNQGCFDRIFKQKGATCLVNPRAGMEGQLQSLPPKHKKNVLVVGGGPAGLKAACTAAERGHRVRLIEQSDRLGGQLLLNRAIPGREEIAIAAADLVNNLKALHVEIILNKKADHAFISDTAPDVVILATGASPLRPDISGIEGHGEIQAWELLAGKTAVGKRVVIIGGNAVGLETALFLSHQGTLSPEILHFLVANRAETWETLEDLVNRSNKKVTVLEMTKKAGKDIGGSTRWTVMSELKRLGVTIVTGATALEVIQDGLKFEKEGVVETLHADSIVIATGAKSERELMNGMKDLVSEVYVIGDAKEPRNALEAIKEGYLTGLKI